MFNVLSSRLFMTVFDFEIRRIGLYPEIKRLFFQYTESDDLHERTRRSIDVKKNCFFLGIGAFAMTVIPSFGPVDKIIASNTDSVLKSVLINTFDALLIEEEMCSHAHTRFVNCMIEPMTQIRFFHIFPHNDAIYSVFSSYLRG